MHSLVILLEHVDNAWIREILEVFEPLLKLIALDDEFFTLKQKEFMDIIGNEKEFLVHPFHRWFPSLLKNVIILDSQAVYDTIRDLFLNRMALKAPNCLSECSNNHACCHGNYRFEVIDYQRIIVNDLLDPSYFSRSGNKYKIKLSKDQNRRKYCSALDISTKKCLVHQFKPSTCCKYPLISNIQNWSKELMAWTGNCAHSEEIWATRVHPAIMNSCRDLWGYANLLWESEQNVFYRIREPLHAEIRKIISQILSIQLSSWPYKNKIIKGILMEEYPQSSIQEAFSFLSKL